MATFGILGPIELRAGDRRVPAGGPRQLALLAFLLLHANRAVSNDQLQDALWRGRRHRRGLQGRADGGRPAAQEPRALRAGADAKPPLRTVSGGYLLTVAPGELDADVLRGRASRTARARLGAGDPASAAGSCATALALWRGPALAEVAFEAVRAPGDRAAGGASPRRRSRPASRRISRSGATRALVAELERARAPSIPTRERTVRAAHARALPRRAGRADALDVYQRVSAHLSERARASSRARRCRRCSARSSSKRRRCASAAPARAAASRRARRRRCAPALPRALASARERSSAAHDDARRARGRRRRRRRGGRAGVVMLAGEPGIGKTRLAPSSPCARTTRGAIVLYGRCDEEPLRRTSRSSRRCAHYVAARPGARARRQVELISGELRAPRARARRARAGPARSRWRAIPRARATGCSRPSPRCCASAAQHAAARARARRPALGRRRDAAAAEVPRALPARRAAHGRSARTARRTSSAGHPLAELLADLAREQAVERVALARPRRARGRRARRPARRRRARSPRACAGTSSRRPRATRSSSSRCCATWPRRDGGRRATRPALARRLPVPEGVTRPHRPPARAPGRRNDPRARRPRRSSGATFEFDAARARCSDLGEDALVDALERGGARAAHRGVAATRRALRVRARAHPRGAATGR